MPLDLSECGSRSGEERIRAFVEDALERNIYFSQVREDPVLDERAISKYFEGRSDLRMAMVASGGDTCAYLLGAKGFSFSKIFVVDPNPAQLALTRIKLHLLTASRESRLALLGHTEMDAGERRRKVREVMRELGIDEGVFGRLEPDMSLDASGRYERLFALFRSFLEDCKGDIEDLFRAESVKEQREILSKESVSRAMERGFACAMDIRILDALFGHAATGNRTQAFAAHFLQATRRYLENSLASQSPFAAQLLLGRFHNDTVYPWMELPSVGCDTSDGLEFVEGRIEELLERERDLDVVHVSNVPDWLGTERTEKLLRAALRSLREGGIVILRILNSAVDPRSVAGFEWAQGLSQELHSQDRSFFYRDVLVGRKTGGNDSTCIALADEVLGESRLFSARFFGDVECDRVLLPDFREMQKRFFFAVSHFSRPMAALVSRIGDHDRRMKILENIMEEHGNGSHAESHERTFLDFLDSIGCSLDIAEPAEVYMFNVRLMGVCTGEDVRTAVGCLGIIEYAFSAISQIIGSHVVRKGWARDGKVFHYSLHSTLDIRHSADFFSLIDVSRSAEDMKRFRRGLELGACIFRMLYESIYRPLSDGDCGREGSAPCTTQ